MFRASAIKRGRRHPLKFEKRPQQIRVPVAGDSSTSTRLKRKLMAATGSACEVSGSRIDAALQWSPSSFEAVTGAATWHDEQGSTLVLWQDLPFPDAHYEAWRWMARAITVVAIVASFAAAAVPRFSRLVACACLAVGISLAVAGILAQYPALNSVNSHLQSEEGLGESPLKVAIGMFLASAPAAILGLRIGRMRLCLRKLVLTSFWRVWLPLLTSVAVVSVAKMFGARLYWEPSLPIGYSWAFVWLSAVAGRTAAFLWLGATLAAPLVVVTTWITDMGRHWRWKWQKVIALAGAGVGGYHLRSQVLWDSASRSWLWSIILASVALGAIHVLIRVRKSLAVRSS